MKLRRLMLVLLCSCRALRDGQLTGDENALRGSTVCKLVQPCL
jgi:hypothetical protein